MRTRVFIVVLFSSLILSAQESPLQKTENVKSEVLPNNNSRLGGSTSQSPQTLIALYDSIYNWKLDTAVMQWKYKSKTVNIAYDSQQNEISYLNQIWNGSNWINFVIDSEIYINNNKRSSQLQKTWNGTGWTDSLLSIYSYDTIYNLLSKTTKKWNGSALAFFRRDSNAYDIHNNHTLVLNQKWSGSSWVDTSKVTDNYTYNSNNSVIQDSYYVLNQYNYSGFFTYTYNSNNYVSTILNQTTPPWGGPCNDARSSYAYDINNNLVHRHEDYFYSSGGSGCGGYWNPCFDEYRLYDSNSNLTVDSGMSAGCSNVSYIKSYTYDLNNNVTHILYKQWNGSAFANNYKDSFTYDNNNLKKTYTHKVYNNAGNKIISGDSTVYYFGVAVDVKQIEHPANQLIIYPNPTSSNLTVESNSSEKITQLEIIDVFGREILLIKIKNKKETIDVSILPNGIYFIKSNVGVQKFIKQ